MPLAPALRLPEHPYQHRPERPVLLAVDQELGEGPALRMTPELADSLGALEVGEHQDVEQLDARSGAERVQALSESALELVGAQLRRMGGGYAPATPATWAIA